MSSQQAPEEPGISAPQPSIFRPLEEAPRQAPDKNARSTHHERNTHLPAQPEKRARHPLTEAEKATRALQRKATDNLTAAFHADLDEYLVENDIKIKRLAEKHSKKIEYVRSLLQHSTRFKKHREVSLRNALIHAKGKEVNRFKAPGDRLDAAAL
ncbi:hypothetical protein HGRIS_010461 [Hohenbuehelia grisea]|uniref:Uncharacterized protein n=1 Tax=Hohenbuehelia grisea TaxID=104357 RepID=A0ABR3IZK8_9AGAR